MNRDEAEELRITAESEGMLLRGITFALQLANTDPSKSCYKGFLSEPFCIRSDLYLVNIQQL